MKTASLVSVLALAACGSSSSSKSPDAAANVPAMITISGTASERSASGTTMVQGAAVAAYESSDPSTPVATAMTDASGNYSLTIATNGKAIDGFVKATKTGYVDTYLYAPYALTADFSSASLNMFMQNTLDFVSSLCHAQQDAAKGMIAIEVVDSTNTAVAGATVSSSPAPSNTCFDSGGFPSSMATATADDGIGILFNVTGQATVSASKSGVTFKSHAVNAVAGAFTTTLITQ